MTSLTGPDLPAVARGRDERLADLVADLVALEAAPVQRPTAEAVQTRPSVLRRVAELMAERIEPGVDRLVGAVEMAPLVTAVALHTGLPDALIDAGAHTIYGELHPSERVTVIAYAEVDPELTDLLANTGVENDASVSVFGREETALFCDEVLRGTRGAS